MRFSFVVLSVVVALAVAADTEKLRIVQIDRVKPKAPVISRDAIVNGTQIESLGVDISTIVLIGKSNWNIVSDGKSVVTTSDWAGAIPKDTTVNSLSGWTGYSWGPFGWTFTNTFGMETVRFTWNFAYKCKGSYGGKGAFLTGVSTPIKEIYAAWGFTVDSAASIEGKPVNYGSAAAPVAGLPIEVTLKVSSVLQSFTERCRVAVRGDCTVAKVAC